MENEAEHYYLYLRRLLGCKTQTQVANKIGVSQPAITGWLKRNSFELIREHIINLGFDIAEIDEKVKNNDFSSLEAKALPKSPVDEFLKDNAFLAKEKFLYACEQYKITHEDIALATELSPDKLKNFIDSDNDANILADYDELLSKCFFQKYQTLMKNNVSIPEPKLKQFALTYNVKVRFPQPLFWLIWCCLGFLIFEKKMKAEEVEDFLDILIQNRVNFGDDLSAITTSEELIDVGLEKVEELLPKPKSDPVEEFIKLS